MGADSSFHQESSLSAPRVQTIKLKCKKNVEQFSRKGSKVISIGSNLFFGHEQSLQREMEIWYVLSLHFRFRRSQNFIKKHSSRLDWGCGLRLLLHQDHLDRLPTGSPFKKFPQSEIWIYSVVNKFLFYQIWDFHGLSTLSHRDIFWVRHHLSSFSLFETTLIWSGVLSGPSIVCTVSWVGRSNACRASLLKSSCVSFNLSRFSIWICSWSFHSILCSNLFNCWLRTHYMHGRRLCDQLINNCCRFILTHYLHFQNLWKMWIADATSW